MPIPTAPPDTPLSDPRITLDQCPLEELEEMKVQVLAELELSSSDNLNVQNSHRSN